jgi:ABC-type sugar transport system substrate-binding protein
MIGKLPGSSQREEQMSRAGRLTKSFALSAMALGVLPMTSDAAGPAKVAIALSDLTTAYKIALHDGAMAEGHKLGVAVVVQAGSGPSDATGENTKISTMANQDYTCFAAFPVNGTNVITPLIPISQKGIPIVIVDSALEPSAVAAAGLKITSFIGSDNKHAGKLDGEFMVAKVPAGGKVAILEGISGEQNGIDRMGAFREAVSGKLDVVASQPADYDRGKALTVTEAWLKIHPDLAGIFAANDSMGLGAKQAVENAGLKGKVVIVSIDGTNEALESIKAGGLSATVSQYPYAEGQMIVQACHALAGGRTIPAEVESPIQLISEDNVDKAIAASPKPFFDFEDPFGAP